MLAKETDLEPGEAIWYGVDVHLYLNHIEQAKERKEERTSRGPRYALPVGRQPERNRK